jgi:VanZ family protein
LHVLVAERTKRLLFALWCLLWIVVVAKSLQPNLQLPLGLPDKLVHFGTCALMAALVAAFCHVPRRIWLWAALAVVMGGLLELGQGLIPSRSLELGDFLAKAAGAGCAAILATAWTAAVVRPLRLGPAR